MMTREYGKGYDEGYADGLKDAIEQAQPSRSDIKQEPVTILPDGSAFGVMSWPLPKNHWLYAEREYRDGEYEPVELGKPILTHQLRDEVVSAVRYAIRGATNCGKDVDFDPDALVQNAVYALCGPYSQLSTTQPQEAALQRPQNCGTGYCSCIECVMKPSKEAAPLKPLTREQRFDLLTEFEPHRNKWEAPAILIDMVEAAHGITGEKE